MVLKKVEDGQLPSTLTNVRFFGFFIPRSRYRRRFLFSIKQVKAKYSEAGSLGQTSETGASDFTDTNCSQSNEIQMHIIVSPVHILAFVPFELHADV